MLADHDERIRRCPRLGHEVGFKYCRTQEGQRPCANILNCWWERFNVTAFLRDELPPEEYASLIFPPPPTPKVDHILELIQKAKRAKQCEDGDDHRCTRT